MVTLRHIGALATACYDAALGATTWDRVLGDIAGVFRASHATLLRQELQAAYAQVLGSHGFEAGTVRVYEEYFKTRNLFLTPRNRALMRPGVVRTGQMMCPDDVLLHSEYYNDFLRPLRVRHLIGTTARLIDRDAVHLTVFRGEKAGAAASTELKALTYLAPHVQRALQVHEQLDMARGAVSALEDLLERCPHGTALLTGTGVPRFMNAALQRMVAARDGLGGRQGTVAPQERGAARAFQRALASAAAGAAGDRFAVPRPSGEASYLMLVSPTAARDGQHPAADTVLVIVSDPTAPTTFDTVLLRETYGLTAAECALACRLASGLDLEAVAAATGTTMGTAKTHLKRVLAKTGVHRQTDLVRLLLLGRGWT